MQIGLVLGMNVLGIPIKVENYRRICNAVYLAEQVGVYISPSRVLWDPKTNQAYSPKTHEDGDYPSWNLLDDVRDIQGELECGLDLDDSRGWRLDAESVKKLEALKNKLK